MCREALPIGTIAAMLALVCLLLTSGAAVGQQSGLAGYLQNLPPNEIFPGAESLGPVEGQPPAAAALAGGQTIGYVFLNSDIVNATGYSGKPIHVVVGMDLSGRIVGARMVQHAEPIVLIGIPEQKIHDFIQGYVGYNVFEAPTAGRRGPPVDIVTGATVTVLVIGDTITRAAILIARARGLGGQAAAAPAAGPQRQIDMTGEGSKAWQELLQEGSVARLHLTVGEINQAFEQVSPEAAARPDAGQPDATYIDLYTALVSAPVVGRSLLGPHRYLQLQRQLKDGEHAILVMGRGPYSWRGSGYVRGGIFDRVALIQDAGTVRFHDRDYRRLGEIDAEGAPYFPEVGLFVVPEGSEFDPTRPWRLQLLVQRAVGALDKVFLTYELPYELPAAYMTAPPAAQPAASAAAAPAPAATAAAAPELALPDEPLWKRIWVSKFWDLMVVAAAMGVLTLIFFFQDWLVKRPRLQYWVRTAFLLWTLLWLGWYALAQLSVVNILTLTNSLIHGFSWDYFLMDPLLFVLWSAVAASLLFWARGAFCGWLCPFGALQEFVNRIARFLKVPQLRVPWGLHERLWAVKYIIFLGLFGVALYELAFAERLAEVEPFKTAIILHFVRDWPFVTFAAVLLAIGMFVERFFCRYLCPLGAALAIPARIRMFEWLKRHRECGQPCQRCAVECPVDSIHPDGRINPNECIYCMHCQLLYWDEHKCPAMIQRRLKRERAVALSSPPGGKAKAPAMSAANPASWEARDPAPASPPSPPRI